MAQQLQVNLSFTADSAKAKAQIQDLQNSLNNLMKNNPTGKADLPVTKELLKAQQAAAQLSISLKNATNVNTGKLNLTQFSSELQKSGMTLEKYRIQLSALGPEGEKTFLNLAKSVMTADSAIKNSNKLVNDLWISLKNTAKWQLSSSIVKGFMGAISTAFNYAEDLNKSLNQIQIVTGNSAEQMARFAKQANIAAKELSTTTTAYTDASLIYYQQGLDDASVKARTDITVKAANAAGTNAEEMADYLTAVWNSYKVGSDELERYVDVMAALGAGTATSLEEISTAMEKVASVGEATGVKFEQMSSIIATVSSVTRQSAETVGTAFKTIFARMADLKLEGSIEEDGVTTTFGTVSEQLAQVGVNILDANGNLKDMGDVMEALMGKWDSMNEATQQAVAIAVAGKRQYTQLLALMNNQEMYQEAMGMATGAEGTLQEQADTYAKSWEAAQKRVKAAAQGIYDSLINDDFFIGMNNGIADVLGMIEKLIDSMGGFSGVLGGLGALVLKVFDKQINAGLQKTIQSIYSTSEIGKKQAEILRQQAFQSTQQVFSDRADRTETGSVGIYDQASLETQKQRLELEKQFIDNAKTMTEDEILLAQKALDTNKAYEERVLLQAKEREKYTNLYNENYADAKSQTVLTSDFGKEQESINRLNELLEIAKQNTSEISMSMKEAFSGIDVNTATFSQIENGIVDIGIVSDEVEAHVDELWESLIKIEKEGINTTKGQNDFKKLKQTIQDLIQGSNTMEKEFIKSANAIGINTKTAKDLIKNYSKMNESTDKAKKSMEDFKQASQNLNQGLQTNKTVSMVFVENLMSSFRAVSSLTIGLSSLKGAFQALNDPDMSTFDKVTSVLMSLSIGIPSVISGVNLLRESFVGVASGIQEAITAELGLLARQAQRSAQTVVDTTNIATNTAARKLNNIQTQQSYGYTALETIALQANVDATKLSTIESLKLLAAQKLGLIAVKEDGTFQVIDATAKGANTVATWLLKIAQDALNGSIGATLALLGILVIAIGAAVAIVYGLVKAFQALSVASPEEKLKKANEEVERTKTVFKEASESVDKLKSSLDSLEDSYKNLNNLTKGTKEYNEALEITNQKALELMSTNATLAKGMYLDDNIIKFSEDSIQQAIKESEGHKIVAYGENINAQIERKKAELDVQASKIANKEFNAEGKEKNWNSTYARDESYKHYSEKDLINYANEYLNQGEDFFNHPYTKMTNTGTSIDNIITSNDKLQQHIRELAEILKQQNDLTDTQNELLAQSISQNLGITEEDYTSPELYAQAKEKSIDQATKLIGNWNDHSNYEENDQIVTDFIKAQYGNNPESNVSYVAQRHGEMIISVDGEEEKFTEAQVKSSLATYYASDEYAKLVNDKIIEDIKTIFEKSSISEEDISNLSQEEAIALGNNKDLLTYVSENTSKDLNIQDLQALSELLQNNSTSSEIKEVGEALGLTNEQLDLFVLKVKESSSSISSLDTISEIIKNLSAGEELEEDQLEVLQKLEKEYPILAQIQDETSREYLNKLKEIKEEINNANFQKAADSYKEAFENFKDIDININDKDFKAKLDELITQDYNLTITIETNIKQAVDEVQSSVDGIENAVSKISDGFKVAADDIIDLENTFPGITEQYSVTADGMVQLNAQIAQSAIQSAKDEVFARKESVQKQIEAEIAYLQTKSGIYRAMGEAFLALAESDVDAEEAKIQAQAILQEGYVQINSANEERINKITEAGGTINVENAKSATDGETEQLEVLTQNSAQAYSEVARQSAEAAKARIANAVAVANAEKTGTDTSGSLQYSPANNTFAAISKEAKKVTSTSISDVIDPYSGKNVQDIINNLTNSKDFKKDLQHTGTAYLNAANLLDQQIGKMRSYSASLEGWDKELQDTVNNASTGGSPEKSKSGSGGDKSGSGGGKSGSSSKPETADLKNLDEEITRYKNIDNQLDSIENHLDKISHKKDQAYGKKYIDALYEENEALQKQIDLHKQSQQDAIKYQAWDKQKVAELGFNIETDEAGYVTNEEQFDAWVTQNKNAIELGYTNSVNALGEDSNDQKNALEEQKQAQLDNIEAAKTYFNLYKEATERRYEDESAIEELLAQQRENNFDAINHKFEVQMDLLDREEKQVEHLRKTFREGLFGLADNTDADNSLIGKNLKLLDKIEEKKKDLDEAFSTGAISESQYIEGMQAIDDEAGEVYDSIIDLSDAIGDRFIEALNEADEIMDKSISKFGHLRTIMNSVENLIKLTYGEEDFNALGDVYENIAYASEKELKYNREMFEERKKTMDEARRQYNEALAGNIPEGKTLDQLKENLEEAENSVREWQEKMYSSAEAFAEDIINVYQNRVNKAMKQFEADLTGGSTFDQMKKELEMLQATDTDYLTGVNQQYETQKMIRTATNALESASNKMAKEKLNLFIEETKELQKKDKLSEYELGLQQRKYEIALAEIALQEAQNNKSQVRLQKDSEGNFNYVYTADEDKVAEAQQQYEDAQNDLYNYAREKENEIQQARLENWEAYWNEVNELSLDQTLNEEDRAVKLAEIRSRYLQRDVELTEQSNLTKEYSDQSYRDSYTINIADQIATTNEAKVAQKQASAEIIDANEELKEKTHEYTDLMNQDYIKVKDNADNYAINVENDMARTGDALKIVQTQTAQWANAMTTLLDNVAGRYNNLSNACQNAMETISGFFADTDYSLMWQNAQSLDEARYAVSTRRFMVDNNIAGKGIYAQNEEGLNAYDIWNQSQMIASSSTPEEAIRHAYLRIAKVEDAPGIYENMESTLEVLKEKFQKEGWDESLFDHIKSEASRFDTGGYTGEFGPEGKFAMLHEKELVLNQQDTQNLLDTVDIVDKLLNSLEYQNLLYDFNISNIGNGINKNKDTLEQDVTIHAEFPNVQDHNEIEMALSNLVNTASQYANRKKS